mgnify:CR=1 FL=1
MTIFVSDEAFELVVERVALHVELSHHTLAVNILRELEFILALFGCRSHFPRFCDLLLHFDVLQIGVRRDGVL